MRDRVRKPLVDRCPELPKDVRQAIKRWNIQALLRCRARYERLKAKCPKKAEWCEGVLVWIASLLTKAKWRTVDLPKFKARYFKATWKISEFIKRAYFNCSNRNKGKTGRKWQGIILQWLEGVAKNYAGVLNNYDFMASFRARYQAMTDAAATSRLIFPNSTKTRGAGWAEYQLCDNAWGDMAYFLVPDDDAWNIVLDLGNTEWLELFKTAEEKRADAKEKAAKKKKTKSI